MNPVMISAPSGCSKDTIIEKVCQHVENIICAVRRRTMLHKELIDQINTAFA